MTVDAPKKRRRRRRRSELEALEEPEYIPSSGRAKQSENYFAFEVAQPPKYVPGSGLPLQQGSLSYLPVHDSTLTGYIVEKRLGTEQRYLVGFQDQPNLRILVGLAEINEYVPQDAIEDWERAEYDQWAAKDAAERLAILNFIDNDEALLTSRGVEDASSKKKKGRRKQNAVDDTGTGTGTGTATEEGPPRKRGRPPKLLHYTSPSYRTGRNSLSVPVRSLAEMAMVSEDSEDVEFESTEEALAVEKSVTESEEDEDEDEGEDETEGSKLLLGSSLGPGDITSREAYLRLKVLQRQQEQQRPKDDELRRGTSEESSPNPATGNVIAPSLKRQGPMLSEAGKKMRYSRGGAGGGGRYIDEHGNIFTSDGFHMIKQLSTTMSSTSSTSRSTPAAQIKPSVPTKSSTTSSRQEILPTPQKMSYYTQAPPRPFNPQGLSTKFSIQASQPHASIKNPSKPLAKHTPPVLPSSANVTAPSERGSEGATPRNRTTTAPPKEYPHIAAPRKVQKPISSAPKVYPHIAAPPRAVRVATADTVRRSSTQPEISNPGKITSTKIINEPLRTLTRNPSRTESPMPLKDQPLRKSSRASTPYTPPVYDLDDENEEIEEQSAGEEYEVEAILEEDIQTNSKGGKEVYYKIKWLGYGDDSNTWEPAKNVGAEAIKVFEEKRRVKQNETTKKKVVIELSSSPSASSTSSSADEESDKKSLFVRDNRKQEASKMANAISKAGKSSVKATAKGTQHATSTSTRLPSNVNEPSDKHQVYLSQPSKKPTPTQTAHAIRLSSPSSDEGDGDDDEDDEISAVPPNMQSINTKQSIHLAQAKTVTQNVKSKKSLLQHSSDDDDEDSDGQDGEDDGDDDDDDVDMLDN